ncbi:MAG TPA: toxin-antitoxin system HicB family antitoxin [Candidatus Deferrimicrobium sp.]|nr:toxin-antitoxin system HicB family antitoxin [Candidatus Deferrimicrobium sp.]
MARKKTSADRDRLIHIRLSAEVHRRLKVHVAQQGTSLQDWVAKAIYSQLDQQRDTNNATNS